ncbi:hypothetical protein [Synechococcus sp. PCC 7336]|uniref:hypothetical protein n=1 Tax=Synechococcus sp. PCC 7336 TaxID=195250 RepID=UPI0003473EDC|nr:hypothetical protein [Synechococcus sp. PCC 7336]
MAVFRDDFVDFEIADLNKDVTVTVTVGEGNLGGSSYDLNGEFIRDVDGDGIPVKIGTGNEMNGKKLRIVTTVTDSNARTNRTSIALKIENQGKRFNRTYIATVDEDNETAIFLTLITFR